MELQSICCCSCFANPSYRLSKSLQIHPFRTNFTSSRSSQISAARLGRNGYHQRVLDSPKWGLRVLASSSSSVSENRPEPYGGKSGSASFAGITHHVIEERKLVSSPFKNGKGSFVWVLAPLALISSLILPQLLLSNAIDALVRNEVLAEIVISFSSEVIFYFGLATFLLVANHVQKPFLQFSPKRWDLITGLKGYISSSIITMGMKVFAPFFAVVATWSVLGVPALVAVLPIIVGFAVQFVFEVTLERHGASCWPVVPIIFEVYRLYQLSKAANFIERLMYSLKAAAVTPQTVQRNEALIVLLVCFQVLAVVCLWSLASFLLRLFTSRPVAENY